VNKRNSKIKSRTDWVKVDAMTDDEIDYSEIPELGPDFFQNAVLRMPESKVSITVRVDKDVLDWFKQQGAGYQTRINALMRAYMEAQGSSARKR
jgi:uncharacterized protein (DUF4415 family)